MVPSDFPELDFLWFPTFVGSILDPSEHVSKIFIWFKSLQKNCLYINEKLQINSSVRRA